MTTSRARLEAIALALPGCTIGTIACQADADDLEDVAELRGADAGAPDHAAELPVEIDGTESGASLRWHARPGATYSVYRSADPDFTPSDDGVTLLADDLVVGEYDHFPPRPPVIWAAPDSFYRVVEHTEDGDVSSAVMGRISRWAWHSDIYSHEPLHHEKVPLCLVPTPADTLRQVVVRYHAESIHGWDPAQQAYRADGPPFMSVLELEPGTFFSMRIPPTTPVHGSYARPYGVAGRVPALSELVTSMVEGNNAVTWPITATPTTAGALLDGPLHVPHATAIGWWDRYEQAVLWYPELPSADLPGVDERVTDDFAIDRCSTLYVHIDAGHPEGTALKDVLGLTWPPTLAATP